MVAEVILNSNVKDLNRVFDYNIPIELEKKVAIGSRVFVPFGNIKSLEEGFVINIKKTSEFKIKDIKNVEKESLLSPDKIELSKWMADRYFCNISDCIKLMLPAGTTSKIIKNRVKEKNASFVYLLKDEEEIQFEIESKKLKSDKQIRALRFLIENGEVLVSDIEMFADVSKAVINTLVKNKYVEIVEKQVERNPFINKRIFKTTKLKLTEEQQEAYNSISENMNEQLFSEFLIYGVTGSRKNRNIFTIDRKMFKRRENKHYACS